MNNKLKDIVEVLTKRNQTISTMESCTGGGLANAITNIEGSSNILKFSAVTYSNEYKIKMGVPKEIIDKYTVYSIETARAMAKSITNFTNSDNGIGITGKLNRVDKSNLYGSDNTVYISIYDKDLDKFYNYNIDVDKSSRKENNKYYDKNIFVTKETRIQNKEDVINTILDILLNILKK